MSGQWIVGVISFQKMYGLYGLKHHIVEISGDVTDAGRTNKQTNKQTSSEDRATQLLICEKLSLAILIWPDCHDSQIDFILPTFARFLI